MSPRYERTDRGCTTMGTGVLHGRSSKQKLNTKSSTETELVGGSDYLPFPIWQIQFMKAQGYEIKEKILHQDNQSTIKMLTNGRKSAGKNSRHVNIQYFWIKDRLQNEGIRVEYCPTLVMLADFFTKPLQGKLFRIMRDVVQGLKPIEDLSSLLDDKERVGNTDMESSNKEEQHTTVRWNDKGEPLVNNRFNKQEITKF